MLGFDTMKTLSLLILLITAATVQSEPKPVIFTVLYSTNHTALMTNAEFRTTSGSKVFFVNEKYRGFEAIQLDTNVLERIGTTLAKLEAAQVALDAKNTHARLVQQADLAEANRQAAIKSVAIQNQSASEQSKKLIAEEMGNKLEHTSRARRAIEGDTIGR